MPLATNSKASSPLKLNPPEVSSANANKVAFAFGLQMTNTSPEAIVPVKGIGAGVVPPFEYRLIT